MKKYGLLYLLLLACFVQVLAQKKQLEHEDCSTWLNIASPKLSNDGRWAVYELKRGDEGDTQLKIYDVVNRKTHTFARATGAKISADNAFVAFKITPYKDSLKAMRRRKVEKEDLPKDTLGIFDLKTAQLTQVPNLKSFKLGKEWGEYIAYQFDPVPPPKDTVAKDATVVETKGDTIQLMTAKTAQKKKQAKRKKASQKNGFPLVIQHWASGSLDTFEFVKDYQLAKKSAGLVVHTSGKDSTVLAGVYHYDFAEKEWQALHRSEGKYKHLSFDETAKQLAFLADVDTTEARIRPFGLYHCKISSDTAQVVADDNADFLPDTWRISEHGKPSFSENGQRLFFGISPPPILQDTSLLEEEIVNVEVWHYKDLYLHPQQKVNVERERKRSYRTMLDVNSKKIVQLADEKVKSIGIADEQNSNNALGLERDKYGPELSWVGFPQAADLYAVDVPTGKRSLIAEAVRGNSALSPNGDYIYWYSTPDTAWFAYRFATKKTEQLTNAQEHYGYDELNDRPMHPYPEGSAGWTTDGHLLTYDWYDIWKLDPTNTQAPTRLTRGRESGKVYRYIRLDREEREINTEKSALLSVFDTKTKASGYASFDFKTNSVNELRLDEDYSYSTRPIKAKEADVLLTTRQNFRTFPDLHLTNTKLQDVRQISDANPQQQEYSWGTMELHEWTALDGQKLQGLLVKPDNFDPKKKYPLLVNFYERSSDRLHRYRTPRHGRSSVNYSFYVSRGYVIFNPDVPYREGYPGESAYNAVISGITSLSNQGFIDEARIGMQGHSWGGYQAAYLATKTDIFKCIEAGAPVVNMISAYGGIRWRTGMSRMFQYEHTQSRIGGTIWDVPLRYIENSPIFFVDKINTPILIMHNDKDGAVPWYQGIEFFVAMRRLGKPAWLLNYNDEPHWASKMQNRKDFQKRMQQFFDYYLMDAPEPSWMQRGVPAIEKGIKQGLD